MADLADVERMVTDWERNAAETSQKYQAMQAEVERISITESVASGAVSVTVGHNGLPTDVKMTQAVLKMSPDEIAANVLRAMQKAQSKYPERLAEITAETVGDDATTRHLVATAVDNFPAPPEEEEPSTAGQPPQRQLYESDEEPAPAKPVPPKAAPPAPKPTPRRKAGPDDEDGEDFSDQSFLRRD
ncbi:YbaB/EbfC family nucleoid-associated protein [Amycolatopsis sp. 195334CR]|uniref:YbaB/EbfC family nucleoid-associated protein n=1 Tax=Amycolatopsis sp. 195334CR TaxID=2814588 RepID=UPI001A8FCF41|nr:YbaB/EbfC family nucleoid-associated protein [Amycolatopsis sp. 195334CR]MBN6034467.1 YbaB/EbfC family nucleoid-associated protein [Amycolatopsis sp. 195334CR]